MLIDDNNTKSIKIQNRYIKGIRLLWYSLKYIREYISHRKKSFKNKTFEVSKYGHNHAETIVGVSFASVPVEIEHTSIRRVIVIAATIEERPLSVRKVRVVA